jgi:phosphoglycolate phosphatase
LLFIFDWDGTLSDSKAKITHSMQFAAQDMGWEPLADDLIHNIIGLGLPEAILYLYPAVSAAERAQLRERYAENFLRLDEQKASDFFPLVNETLSTLRAQGHLLTIATGKSRKGLDRILGALGMSDYFDATRCADETASKPSPLMLEELLQQFGVEASDAVMIGDTEYDMAMARNINMPRIAVSYGAHHADRLRPYHPELCIDSIDEILNWHRI